MRLPTRQVKVITSGGFTAAFNILGSMIRLPPGICEPQPVSTWRAPSPERSAADVVIGNPPFLGGKLLISLTLNTYAHVASFRRARSELG